MDPVTGALERSLETFAHNAGITVEPTEARPETGKELKMAAVKKAAEDMKGSQVQTTKDPGDYGTAAEALGAQVKETKGGTPAENDTKGLPNETMHDPENYTLAARKAMETVAFLARKNAEVMTALTKHAEDLQETEVEMGGEPEAVAQADEEAPPAAAPAPAPVAELPATDGTSVVLEQKVTEKEKEVANEKAVINELKDVLKEVQVAASKKKQAAQPFPAIDEGGVNVSEYAQLLGIPEDRLRELVQEFGDTDVDFEGSDLMDSVAKRAMKILVAKYRKAKKQAGKKVAENAEQAPPNVVKKENFAGKETKEGGYVPASGDPTKETASQAKGTSETTPKAAQSQEFGDGSDKDYKLGMKVKQARKLIADEIAKRVAAGEPRMKVIAELRKSKLAETLRKAQATLQQRKATVGPEGDDAGKDPKSSFTGEEKAKGTEIPEMTEGTDARLESAETSKVVSQAQTNADALHAGDTAGSTVAFSKEEREKISQVVRQLTQAAQAMDQTAEKTATLIRSVTSQQLVKQVVADTIQQLEETSKQLTTDAETAIPTAEVVAKRAKMSKLLARAKANLINAKQKAQLIGGIAIEASYHRERYARVGPAFKTAMNMAGKGHITLDQVGPKLGEFLQMSTTEFNAAAKVIDGLGSMKQASSGTGPSRMRLATVSQDGTIQNGRDDLEDIFNED